MKAKDIFISIFFTLLVSILLIYISGKNVSYAAPSSIYEVFLDGKEIGLLSSEEEFLALVDSKQEQIKNKYNVDKVYPPSGLKIMPVTTYNERIYSANDIYNIIEKESPFSINGYKITIKYKDESKEPLYLQVLKKEDFESAFYDVMSAFIGTDNLDAYKNKTQKEITETGMKIKSIYWDEEITIKESLLSTDKYIFTNAEDISKYLLFGTVEKQKEYIVKDGDSIDDIIEKNNLSIEEFLIANPSIPSANVLLTENQVVSIGLISPVVTIVNENQVVEDIVNKYKTEYQNDNDMFEGQSKTIQKGSDGLNRVTEEVQYKNGDIEQLVISKTSEITPTVNEIVVRGTRKRAAGSYVYINTGNENWYWPTVSPYIITSSFKWRWGSHHNAIDISGSGFGSPIRSATDAVVIETNSSCSNNGYYGSQCGGSYGNFIKVSVNGGEFTIIYAHLTSSLQVSVGDTISRGQIIGYMGNSGSSTGTHLHFELRDANYNPLDPCEVAFSC